MLRIKDGIDLKELEKFGFKYDGGGDFYVFKTELPYGAPHIIIDAESREISTTGGDTILSKLYDLIIAGLVEKVEE